MPGNVDSVVAVQVAGAKHTNDSLQQAEKKKKKRERERERERERAKPINGTAATATPRTIDA